MLEGIILFFIGCTPAWLLRLAILKRPLSFWPAFGISFLLWIAYIVLSDVIFGSYAARTYGSLGGGAAVGSFLILSGRATKWGKDTKPRQDSLDHSAAPSSHSAEPTRHVSPAIAAPIATLAPQPQTPSFNHMKTEEEAARVTEEELYAKALREIEPGGVRRDGIWAKALAGAGGDDKKTIGLYIEYRVQSLRDESELNKAAAEKQATEARAAAGIAREPEPLLILILNTPNSFFVNHAAS